MPDRLIVATVLLLVLPIWASPPARAQSSGESSSNTIGSLANGPETNLFGDWGGWRTRLSNNGIDLSLSYNGEAAANVAGGKRRGIDYAGQEEAKFAIDWGKIAGLQGFSTHFAIINRNGRNASYDYIGDDLLQAQEIYGGTGNVLIDVPELYLEQKFPSGLGDVKAGRMSILNDFAYLPDACDFMSLGVCATYGIVKPGSITSFPPSNWGGNFEYKATHDLSLKFGVYEVNPNNGLPNGLHWSLAGATGAVLLTELDYKTSFGPFKLPGIIKVGGYYDTSQYSQFYTAINGAPLPLTTLPAKTGRRTGFYILAQQMLTQTGSQPGEGLTGLAGFMHNTPDISVFQNFAFIGLLDKGLFPARPDDRAGLSFIWAGVSSELSAVQNLQSDLGLPLAMGAPGPQTNEVVLEANYSIAAFRGIDVMPDMQYVIHPSAAHTYPNAFVLGLQIRANF